VCSSSTSGTDAEAQRQDDVAVCTEVRIVVIIDTLFYT
jgi:hypothetical protein